MDIDQARTFLAITAHGSFLEASKQLHLTQSTVSARIQRLEEELGTHWYESEFSNLVVKSTLIHW